MSRAVHEFRDPARFVVGTVGQPGERVFFVQATEAGRTISVRCEKQQAQILSERMGDLLDEILRDIESLDSHTAFLFDKINFLMDATVGFININQNKIIKIFSVASVALLPPTLSALQDPRSYR